MGRTGCSRAQLWRSTEPARAVLMLIMVAGLRLMVPQIKLGVQTGAQDRLEMRDRVEPQVRRDPANEGALGSRIKGAALLYADRLR